MTLARNKFGIAEDGKGLIVPIGSDFHKSVVYFLKRKKDSAVKIGRTRHFFQRIRAIAETAGGDLECLGLLIGGRKLEREMHLKFSDCRLGGEWFAPSGHLLDFIRVHALDLIPVYSQKAGCQHLGVLNLPCGRSPTNGHDFCHAHLTDN